MSSKHQGDLVIEGTTIAGDGPGCLRLPFDQASEGRSDVTLV